ncbi:MAG: sigma-54-dependent Fis family transcriptional regulator, partial [Myxococcales bacterium]|nr:sigma-54-dependent Fis family transcriptional regulator [Myxococcales bacterium]
VVMSGAGTIEAAVEAVQLGAYDFIEKPIRPERLLTTLKKCFSFSRLAAANALLRNELGVTSDLIGESPPMKQLKAMIERVAPTDGRVLILGENGTGKELVAAAIHAGSPRREHPFVKLNCSAVPADLVESELFGHEKGAFTGAIRTHKGRFETADGGTLFLDEIGDMPPLMQTKLLRVLQEGQFERVGGTRTIRTDVRVIAATNRDLSKMVAEGQFREDLFYRLNVVTLTPPPLRDRQGDIAALAKRFLSETAARNRRPTLSLSEGALNALVAYSFPGNVRQLQNLIERLGILTESDEITAEEVRRALPEYPDAESSQRLYRQGQRLADLVKDAEREIIEQAITAHGSNKAAAARALQVERAHFYKKCKALGISGGDEAG